MNQIQQLINQMCPNGVEWKTLGEVLEYEQPTKYIVNSTDYSNDGTPVLTAGATFILGYTKETNGIYTASKDNPVIIFDDFTTSFHWVNFDFKVKSSAMKMLKPINDEVNFRYVYYSMCTINYVPTEHSRQWISTFSKFQIPLPPLAIQTRIVEILDHFTNLTANLTAELNLRRKQFEHYREKLLSLDGVEGVEWKKLGEVAENLSGFPFDSSKFVNNGIKLMRGMNVKRGWFDFNKDDDRYWQNSKGLEKYLLEKNDIIISMDGSLVGKSFGLLSEEHLPLLLVQRVARVRVKKADSHYVYHVIKMSFADYVDNKKTAGAIPHISMKDINNFQIPLPPLATQHSIVSILDKFTALIENIEKELALRQKQYEYYREELLRFGG